MLNKMSVFYRMSSQSRNMALVWPYISNRNFRTSSFVANSNPFGQLTSNKDSQTSQEELKKAEEVDISSITPASDEHLQEFYLKEAKEKQILNIKYVSPLKAKLFELNVKANGFFKNHHLVEDKETQKKYKLSLTPEEIEILEPSIYLQSYRIKSSMKKATQVNRFVRGFKVKHAINQLHFNPKKMATQLELLLKSGLDQAKSLNYNEDGLYIHALWVGSDGQWSKRLDAKGRGRSGIIKQPHVHLKAILKTDLTTRRLNWEKEQKDLSAKPRMFLNNEPLNFKVRPFYKW